MIKDTDIADMVTSTLHKMGKGRFEQIAQELQEYEIMPWLTKKNGFFGGIEEVGGSLGIKEYLMTKMGTGARWVGLFEKDRVNIQDYMTELKVEWCRATDNMAYERRELLENKGEHRINKILTPRRTAMMLRMAQLLEDAFFDTPSASTPEIPWGLWYWVVPNATQGFNGGAATGFTTVGNVNLTNHPTFKNYTDTYAAVTKEDLIEKLRKAHRQTMWKSPVTAEEFRSEWGQRRRLFVNEDTITAMENVGEAQNDNLGRDLAPFDGTMTFRRHPVRYVRKLDDFGSSATYKNPVFMCDLASFKLFVLQGDYLRESDTIRAPEQHNVFVTHIDLSYNTLCINRRANAVLYTV